MEDVSETLFLEQNYPNPFNVSTVIKFNLTKTLKVKLKIYDVTGKEIFILASGSYSEGVYQFVWDGRDKTGHPVPSGTYFCNLTTGSFVKTKQITVTR